MPYLSLHPVLDEAYGCLLWFAISQDSMLALEVPKERSSWLQKAAAVQKLFLPLPLVE